MKLHPRSGNALFLATLVLALVATGMMAVTDQLLGRQRIEVFSRHSTRSQDAADSVAGMLVDRIRANQSVLFSDFSSAANSANPLGNWLTRGYLGNVSDVTGANPTKGLWLNSCLVYWRMEPAACYDRTVTDINGDGVIDDVDVSTLGASNYLVNQKDVSIAPPARGVGTAGTNPGLMMFELTVDAYAMEGQDRMDANPLAVAANLPTANPRDHAPLHTQIKKRVLIKRSNLFRYAIFYNAIGPSGDLEMSRARGFTVIGAVHTNGAAYMGNVFEPCAFGSSPAVTDPDPLDSLPGLRPVSFTAVDGLFCLDKENNFYWCGVQLNPMTILRGNILNNNETNRVYLNSVQLTYTAQTVGGQVLQKPVVSGPLLNPLTIHRDSRQCRGGSPLSGYDPMLVRDGPNRQLKVIDIAGRLKMSDYRPLEPFALVPPNTPLRGANGTWSVVNGAPTDTRATDMLLFQVTPTTQDILPTQNTYAGDVPSPAIADLGLPVPDPAVVSAFNTTTRPIPGNALNPPVVCRTATCTIDPDDIFSNLANYIQPVVPTNAPVLNSCIRNPLGLNAAVTPGVGIVIMERGKQAVITSWPSGRLGQVSWDPPSVYSTNDLNTGLGPRYYDASGDGTIDPTMAGAFLMDYCQWMRSNYVVYFGIDSNRRLIDITDQFFSVPIGATSITHLLAHEDTFKDRREGRWRQSSAIRYMGGGAANYDDLRVNALTLNLGAICAFIKAGSADSMTLNRLDPATASLSPASARFNGTIYVSRTPRYSNPGVPGIAGGRIGIKASDAARMQTYRTYGEYHPLAPLGFSPLMGGLTPQHQRRSLPLVAADTIPVPSGMNPYYPMVGDAAQASVNGMFLGYTPLPLVDFGSSPQVWSNYPLLKRVRISVLPMKSLPLCALNSPE